MEVVKNPNGSFKVVDVDLEQIAETAGIVWEGLDEAVDEINLDLPHGYLAVLVPKKGGPWPTMNDQAEPSDVMVAQFEVYLYKRAKE